MKNCLEVPQLQNKINHPEESDIEVDSLIKIKKNS